MCYLLHMDIIDIESAIRNRYLSLEWTLDERLRRLYAAAEAKAFGHGGVTLVWKATGVAKGSIQQGLKELNFRSSKTLAINMI